MTLFGIDLVVIKLEYFSRSATCFGDFHFLYLPARTNGITCNAFYYLHKELPSPDFHICKPISDK